MNRIHLFDEIPHLESERLLLREMKPADAPALGALAHDPRVYVYLPTFLFEQQYDDPATVIARHREECFATNESILLAVCEKNDPAQMIGIAEFYNYEPEKEKASVGYRLIPAAWGRGIATETTALLKDYFLSRTDVRKITAHVMAENIASGRVLEKNGFQLKWSGLREDWGRNTPVLINKYIFKIEKEDWRKLLLAEAQGQTDPELYC